MTRPSELSVAVVFPELLGTYGDGGNVVVLERRASWRGLTTHVVEVGLGDAVPATCDLYVLGGGEDRAQNAALDSLRRSTGLRSAVDRGVPVLAVCAGLQLLGTGLTDRDGATTAGVGLLDADTRWGGDRLVGEVVADPTADLGLPLLTGFANHAGRTRLGPSARPLAGIVTGPANDTAAPGAPTRRPPRTTRRPDRRTRRPVRRSGDDGTPTGVPETRSEGALQGSIVATYLHGPVLARNPDLADLLLGRAVGHPLEPLRHPEESAVRRQFLGDRDTPGPATGAQPATGTLPRR